MRNKGFRYRYGFINGLPLDGASRMAEVTFAKPVCFTRYSRTIKLGPQLLHRASDLMEAPYSGQILRVRTVLVGLGF
jgi:hypothetical protein